MYRIAVLTNSRAQEAFWAEQLLAATGLLKEAQDELRGVSGGSLPKELLVDYYCLLYTSGQSAQAPFRHSK